MLKAKSFARIFGRPLDDFWGRPVKYFDGIVRQCPCNVKGFDLKNFVKEFKIRVDLGLPDKTVRKALLRLAKTRWGEEAVETLSRLLPLKTH